MSGDSRQAQLADYIRPPRAGQISVFATSAVAATVDLRTLGTQTATAGSPGLNKPGLPGHYVRIWAVDADAYVAFGSTSASVAGIAAATTGTNAANGCVPIPAGSFMDFLLAEDNTAPGAASGGADTWLGYVTASGTGTIRIAQASQ